MDKRFHWQGKFNFNIPTTWTLKDDFTDTRAAGSVNGTPATPSGNTRTVINDNSNYLSISNGSVNVSNSTTQPNAPDMYYPAVTRKSGLVLLMTRTITGAGQYDYAGFQTSQSSIPSTHSFALRNSGTVYYGVLNVQVYSDTNAYPQSLAIVLRSTGAYFFVKNNGASWKLQWVGNYYSGSPLYPGFGFLNSTLGSYSTFRIPDETWLPTPSAYDTFTRADGVLGNTEIVGPDSQNVLSLAWNTPVGTWGVSSNKASCSSLASGTGIATYNPNTINVFHEAALTRTAGIVGIVVRYTDINNHIKIFHDGTNVQLIKVVGGTPTTLINAAATYGDGYILRVSCDLTKLRVYYGAPTTWARIGSEQTISDAVLQNGVVGLYTTDTGNSIDNVLTFPRGLSNEYIKLDKFLL